ncbi:MAG: SPOR domain-containing protein [Saprospiraceae bacterium]|nr:SPOR domain-containing protein [Saprospiraceae bacterium]MBK6565823.1 SPOR domain-containing protein [Saprospiraceae bacterium]MBK8370166.1 SPOR domain-containing protein [Saprospiraceae bacterium]
MSVTSLKDIIIYYLHLHGGFSHIHLGTITLQRNAASYSTDKKTISPPKTFLTLQKEYKPEWDVSIHSKAFSDIISPLNKFLTTGENESTEFKIPGIGTIVKNKKDISFFPLENLSWDNGYQDWPVLKITPKILDPKNIEFAIEQPKKLVYLDETSAKHKISYLFPILVISLISLVLLGRLIISNGLNEKDNHRQIENIAGNETEDSKKSEPVLDTTLISLEDSTTHSTKKDTTISSLKNNIQNELPTPEKTDKGHNDTKKLLKTSVQNSCIFIVGAFTNKKNAKGLSSKLKKDGFTADIYPSGRFYRVGISLPCQKDTSTAFKELLLKFPDIWLLNP